MAGSHPRLAPRRCQHSRHACNTALCAEVQYVQPLRRSACTFAASSSGGQLRLKQRASQARRRRQSGPQQKPAQFPDGVSQAGRHCRNLDRPVVKIVRLVDDNNSVINHSLRTRSLSHADIDQLRVRY